ncbi:hypothetical protein [Primorskyibacter sp. 2E233]|uniref:hypothetical protein n=1 Tax=Primorskyibacter sp. 2E233 TaxID=3413431 RepID=UPI003BF3ECA8
MANQIKDVAHQAVLEFAALCSLYQIKRGLLSFSARTKADQFVAEIQSQGHFEPAILDNASDLQQCLQCEIEVSGGAPTAARSDEGDLFWLGGSAASRELAELERSLDSYIRHSRYVSLALEAEAAIDRRRARLSTD